MPKKIRWGILGTGTVARDFALDLKLVKDAELTAIASRSADKAALFVQAFGGTKSYEGYGDLVADPDIDIVYIATPNHCHKDHSLLALQANKAVLCEKSFALNAQEAQAVIDVAREKQIFCMEAMWMRFNPVIQAVRTLIQAGELGQVQLIVGDMGYSVPYGPNNRFYSPQGGGALLDRGVYLISLAYFLIGEPTSITSQATIGETGVDEQSSYCLSFEHGAQALLSSTLKTTGTNEVIIIGSEGRIKLQDPFYCPYQYQFTKYFSPVPKVSDDKIDFRIGKKQKLIQLIKSNPFSNKVLTKIKSFTNRQTSIQIPCRGNGYYYEAAAVTNYLQQGIQESPVMPLSETLTIMQTLDKIREQW